MTPKVPSTICIKQRSIHQMTPRFAVPWVRYISSLERYDEAVVEWEQIADTTRIGRMLQQARARILSAAEGPPTDAKRGR